MVKLATDKFIIDNVKLVVFDKDGTIFDLHKYWSFVIQKRSEYFAELSSGTRNDEIIKVFNDLMGLLENNKLSKNGPVGVKSRGYIIDLVHEVVRKYRPITTRGEIENGFKLVDSILDKNLDKVLKKLPGVDKLIYSLMKKKCLIALATSDISKRAINTLTHAKIIDYFNCISASDQVKNPKPDGDIIYRIMENFNIETVTKKYKNFYENVVTKGI